MQFVLIDFENVQPANLDGLSKGLHRIRVFVGASQSKISFETARALQAFGDAAEYVQITGSGRNALDFHVAYYLGRLSVEHPQAQFTIVSKDTGFDPLVKHLAASGVACRRVASVAAIAAAAPKNGKGKASAAPKPAAETPAKPVVAALGADVVRATVERLRSMRSARPRTPKTLASSVKSWHKLDDAGVAALLQALAASGAVKVDGKKLTYRFE